jgi:hypothetical protein
VEEGAEEGRDAVAIVLGLGVSFSLGGAVVVARAVVARDARDGLRGLGLDIGKARLVVQRSRDRHLARAALLLGPRGPDVIRSRLLLLLLDGDGLLPEAEEAPAGDLLLADGVGVAERGTRGTRGGGWALVLLGGANLLTGDFDGVRLGVYAGGAGSVERMESGTNGGGLGVRPSLWDGRSTGTCGGHQRLIFLLERGQGRMLDPGGSSREEEAKGPLRRVLMRIVNG